MDPDGELVEHAWDFDADGVVDALAPITGYTFSTSGTFDVTLTVTDDGGNRDTITYAVDVAADATPESTPFQPPVADFVYEPESPAVDELVTFDGSGSFDFDGEVVSFEWDFGNDGVIDATGETVTTSFSVPGSTDVRLTVADNDGHADTLILTVPVSSDATAPPADGEDDAFLPPLAEFAYSPSSPTAGEPVEFNGMFSIDIDGEVVHYAWDFDGDGVTDSTSPIILFVFGAPGSYDVRLTVTDNDGHVDTLIRTLSID